MNVENYSTIDFEKEYTYDGDDLGAVWTKEETIFRVWAPTAENIQLNLYRTGNEEAKDLIGKIPMALGNCGMWITTVVGDLDKVYYTYSVTIDGEEKETCDPYAKAAGVNGKRAMVIDLSKTNPNGWELDCDPNAGKNITDAIIYELHVRDVSSHESSGIGKIGKFLGLTETGTKTAGGAVTGLDHMKELGITHLHLLPVYDFGSVDEAKTKEAQFNWGYDPLNYNVPEGSYATDPFHGEVRIKEMKQMIQTLHQNGISVVMDVVYNHVYDSEKFCFNVLVPKYFSRVSKNGQYSNGSGCGNDTASERSMVKKYIVDSVCYWAKEYHIDGFRFDLVGLLDIETINEIVECVHKEYPNVIFYGEGWSLGTQVTKEGYEMATQQNAVKTPKFAYFNDVLRDGIKGSVFLAADKGYVTGNPVLAEQIKKCLLGAADWCPSPAQTINYASCHDNYTLMDKISLSMPEASFEEKVRNNCFAAAIYMLSQGVPLLHAGEEMLRSKQDGEGNFVENSYKSPDSVNSIQWNLLEQEAYQKVFAYYKGLIVFRKEHAALRFMTAEEVREKITVLEGLAEFVIGLQIKDTENEEELLLFFNPNETSAEAILPEGEWNLFVNGEMAGITSLATITDGKVEIAPVSAMVLQKNGL